MSEQRPYVVLSEWSEFGRSTVTLECPWCLAEVTAYKWSLAGSGKRCLCGAKFTQTYSEQRRINT